MVIQVQGDAKIYFISDYSNIFLLLMTSSSVFTNSVLPIVGVQLLVTEDGYNIFIFQEMEGFYQKQRKFLAWKIVGI